MLEEGRFHNIERRMRLCQFCNMNMVEDEFHFMLVCPAFRDLRKDILSKYYCMWPRTTKFVKLIYLAFKHRKAFIVIYFAYHFKHTIL